MNKWIFRLTGILVVVLLTLLFLDGWLNPNVPQAIEEGVAVREQAQKPPSDASQDDIIPTPPPLVGLTSLQGEEDVRSTLPLEQDRVSAQATTVTTPTEDVADTTNDTNEIPPSPQPEPEAKPEKETQPIVAPVDSASAPNAWLQAGSFGERANANKRAAVIKAQGWAVEIVPAKVNGKNYHRVYVGPIKQNQVSAYLGKLQAMGIQAREVNR